jgi:hypothetical protein
VRLRYIGYDVVPAKAEPLFELLDHIVATHRAVITP